MYGKFEPCQTGIVFFVHSLLMSHVSVNRVAAALDGAPPPTHKVGRYAIVGELGKGAMGVVYRAEDPLIQRTVALKLLSVEFDGWDGDKARASLLREARAAGRLSHPNIVTVYDVGDDADGLYIAMEFVPGITVRETLDSGVVMPLRRVLDVTMLVARGLDYAHRNGVIHRDIKPANIMLARDGVVKIMDFSIAWADTGKTQAEGMMGSPRYMAPEQIVSGHADARTDIYSLGVTLYEMLAGRTPFEHGSIPEVMHKILNVTPEPPSRYNPEVTPALDAIVLRALAKDPAQRYQRAKDFGRVLLEQRRLMRERRNGTDTRSEKPAVASAAAKASSAAHGDKATAARRKTRAHGVQAFSQPRWLFAALGMAVATVAVIAGLYLAKDNPMLPARERLPEPPLLESGAHVLVPRNVSDASMVEAAPAETPDVTEMAPTTMAITQADEDPVVAEEGTEFAPEGGAQVELSSSEPLVTPAAQAEVREARPVVTQPAPAPASRSEPRAVAGAPARVTLAVVPWGEIFVNGQSRGVTPPLAQLELPPGRHRIEIRNANLRPYVRNLVVEAGGQYRIQHRFRE